MSNNESSPAESRPPRRDLGILTGGLGQAPKLAPRPARGTRSQTSPQSTPAPDKPMPPEKQQPEPQAKDQPKRKPKPQDKQQVSPKQQAKPQPKPQAQSSSRQSPRTSDAGDAVLTVIRSLYIPDDLATRIAAERGQTRMNNTAIVLAAIKTTHRDLPEIVREDTTPQVVHGDLWDEVVTTTRGSGPKRQLQIKPTVQQLSVIDQLVTDTGARDRSHLISLALQTYLDTKE